MTRLTVSKFGSPGFVKDVAEYTIAPQAFNDVRNVRFDSTGAKTFGGEIEVMSQAVLSPLWLKPFPPIDAPLWVYAGLEQVYAYDGAHNQITRISGAYSGSLQERWHAELLNGIGVFNNTIDIPQMWTDFDAAQKLEDLVNWPPTLRAKFLRPYKNFLFAGNLTDTGVTPTQHPYTVRWSDAAAPGTLPSGWDPGDPTTLCGEVDLAETDDYVVDGLGLGNVFIVYKQKTAHAFYFIGLPDVFGNDQILTKGILTRDCVQSYPGGHFVVGIDDIYTHTGNKNSDTSIVEARLRDWVFNQIDATNFFYCYTYLNKRRNEIGFCFPEAGETYPTLCLVWNWVTNGIGVRDLHKSPFIYPGPILVSADDDVWGEDVVAPEFDIISEDGIVIDAEDATDINWE